MAQQNSSFSVYMFVAVLTLVCSLLLAGLYFVLKPIQDEQESLFTKKDILSAVLGKEAKTLSPDQVKAIFANDMTQVVLNAKGEKVKEGAGEAEKIDLAIEDKKDAADRNFPLYIMKKDGKQYYILAVRGNGLWDKIWGYIALDGDLNTIAGVSFDHKGETPGLGAEIKDSKKFKEQFVGEQIYNGAEYVSVLVKKGGAAPEDKHAVDAISGATITCDGVTEMLNRGIKTYLPYLESLKKG